MAYTEKEHAQLNTIANRLTSCMLYQLWKLIDMHGNTPVHLRLRTHAGMIKAKKK